MNSNLRLGRLVIGLLDFKYLNSRNAVFFPIASAIALQVLMMGTARSNPVVVIVPPWSSTLNGSLIDYGCQNVSFCSPTDTQATNLNLTGSKSGISGGQAEGSVTLGPTGGVSVTASGAATVNAGATGTLSYYLYVQAPVGATSPAPVGAFTVINTSVTTDAFGTTEAVAGASISVSNGLFFGRSDGNGFSGVIPLFLSVNTFYQVELSVGASGYDGSYCNPSCTAGSTGTASIDPFFFIDPSLDPTFTGNASDYQIILSDGIGNGAPPPPNAVPLPSTASFLASGLGVLGFLGWRKKRKTGNVLVAAV